MTDTVFGPAGALAAFGADGEEFIEVVGDGSGSGSPVDEEPGVVD